MLDIKINKGNVNAHIEGDVVELTADALTLIHSMFSQLYQDDLIAAVLFRQGIEGFIEDAFKLSTEEVKGND